MYMFSTSSVDRTFLNLLFPIYIVVYMYSWICIPPLALVDIDHCYDNGQMLPGNCSKNCNSVIVNMYITLCLAGPALLANSKRLCRDGE